MQPKEGRARMTFMSEFKGQKLDSGPNCWYAKSAVAMVLVATVLVVMV